MTLSAYKGSEELKNIYIKPVLLKGSPKLSFTYRYKTRDIVKNYSEEEAIQEIKRLFGPQQFSIITLFSLEFDEELSLNRQGKMRFVQRDPSKQDLPDERHDKEKQRKIDPTNRSYLQALQITDASGKVYKNAQNKFKQINHYIEVLSTALNNFPKDRPLNVVDMGSGKGYLTFALYDHLSEKLQYDASVTGVEYRQDMVDLCNQVAQSSGFKKLKFEQGAIADHQPEALDMLIALHACDTATDDAIAKGIRHNADLIVVAPCCHKQIRREMKAGKPSEDLQLILKYGLFLERQAEMVTDSLRAMILEHFGYQNKVIDFIADQHTPKNVLIIAQKKKGFITPPKDAFIQRLDAIRSFWGIEKHYLEGLIL